MTVLLNVDDIHQSHQLTMLTRKRCLLHIICLFVKVTQFLANTNVGAVGNSPPTVHQSLQSLHALIHCRQDIRQGYPLCLFLTLLLVFCVVLQLDTQFVFEQFLTLFCEYLVSLFDLIVYLFETMQLKCLFAGDEFE